MAKSTFAENLDLVQSQVSGFLRPRGFGRTGRTYNHVSPEGLVQVINLQITRPDPVPPALRAAGEVTPPSVPARRPSRNTIVRCAHAWAF